MNRQCMLRLTTYKRNYCQIRKNSAIYWGKLKIISFNQLGLKCVTKNDS